MKEEICKCMFLEDINGMTRIIPRKNFVENYENLAELGTTREALLYLIRSVSDMGFKGKMILCEYDALRAKGDK
jgi:hypothetical protein